MAGSLNKVTLIGNLGKDPEVRIIPGSETKVASFTVATTETRKNKTTGEREDHPEWHRIVIFNEKLAELVEKYVRKGSKLYIEGQLGKYRGDLILLDPRREVSALNSSNKSDTSDMPLPDDKDDFDDVPF